MQLTSRNAVRRLRGDTTYILCRHKHHPPKQRGVMHPIGMMMATHVLIIISALISENELISCMMQAHASATMIQAMVRGRMARARLQEANKAAMRLQTAWRAFAQRRRNSEALQSQAREIAAIRLQACYRGFKERQRRQAEVAAASKLQAFWRMRIQRQRYSTTFPGTRIACMERPVLVLVHTIVSMPSVTLTLKYQAIQIIEAWLPLLLNCATLL